MDDLIVIILTLIIMVIGAIGQIKKKKSQQPLGEKSEKQADFWDLIEEEMEFPRQQVQYEMPREEKTEPAVTGVNRQEALFEEGVSIVKEKNAKITPPFTIATAEKKPKLDFSLRKAVIYSEILNRKYT